MPWRVKCVRMVEHVHGVFCFGSDNRSGSQFILDGTKGWDTKAMRRLFHFKQDEDETWADHYTGTARVARKIWTKLNQPFLSEVIAESMWRAMGWVCDQRPNAVINTLKHVLRWRSKKCWQTTRALEMKKRSIQSREVEAHVGMA